MSNKIKFSPRVSLTFMPVLIAGLSLVIMASCVVPASSAPPASAPAKPAPTKPISDKPATDKPSTDKPGADKPGTDKPAADKPADKGAPAKAATPEPVLENVVTASSDDLISKPQEFLGKNVKFTANFFAFSNLALDYKPAFRSSKTHLSFLVLKSNSHIPLSELKLAMMIPKEKDPESTLLATLKDGDQLEMVGKVFSAALDEPWVEVFKVKKLNASPEEKKASATGGDAGSSAKTGDNKPAEGKDEKPADSKPKVTPPATK